MKDQIHQAVEIALSGTADEGLKTQAIDFINSIKSSEHGYKSCLEILCESAQSPISDGLKFFIYQVIEEYIPSLNDAQLFDLNAKLFTILREYVSRDSSDATYMRNKFAQLFGGVFCGVYLTIYPEFIKDLIASLLAANSVLATDYYTRVIISIHDEIGDKFISRSRERQEHNNLLKDAIRVNDMETLVESWSQILTNGGSHSDDILNNTLRIVGQYINWMEISLFISNPFINCIIMYLNKEKQRSQTCATLIEIISKKMKPENKLQLTSLLNLTSVVNSVDVDNEDIEFMENIARLLAQLGMELLIVIENEPLLVNEANSQLMNLWPLIFSFLSHEYDDVLQQVFPFVHQFLLVCKKNSSLNSPELLSTLLNKIMLKMRYDADDDGLDDDNDRDDGQFSETRASLKKFQDTIAVLRPDLFVEAITIVINELLFSTDSGEGVHDWRRFDLGLYQLHNFAESLRGNLINVPAGEISQSKAYSIYQDFMVKLITLNFLLSINHPKIQMGFFDTVVKNYGFLNLKAEQVDLVQRILQIFISPVGLFNERETVRLRSWYLFFRFIKLSKRSLHNHAFIEELVVKLQPLLAIKAVLPITDEDNDVIEGGNFNSQLYLFETVGILASLALPESLGLKLMDSIFSPFFADLEECVATAPNVRSQQPLIALQGHHTLMAIGTFARGFDHEGGKTYSPEVIRKISDAAQVVLIMLEQFPSQEIIRDSSRFAFSRFIPILGCEIKVHLAKLITLILAAENLRLVEISDFMSFLGQIVHNFHSDDNIYQLLNSLFTPLVDKIMAMLRAQLQQEQLLPELVRDKIQLKKAFLLFLGSLVLNHATSLLVTETNKQKFPEILSTLFEYAYDLSDPSVSRLAITQITNMVAVFGNGGKINDTQDQYGQALGHVEGVDEFLMNKSTELSFALPFQNAQFDLKDAQFRLVGQELSQLLKQYHLTKGDDYRNYLVAYLTNMGLSQDLANDLGSNVVKCDAREFKKYFITFINQLKGK